MKACLNLIIALSSFLFVPVRAQTIVDTCQNVILKGYVIKQYKKSDIEGIKLNTSNIPIDLYQRTYFLPIESDIYNRQTIDSIDVFNPDEVYFPPSPLTNDLIKKYFKAKNSKLLSQNANSDLGVTFFQLNKKQNEFLYKVYYSECMAFKSQILNNSFNTFYLNIPFNKKNKFVTCYFIYQNLILEEIEKINNKLFLKVQYDN